MDLDNLTREQKYLIYEIAQEKKKRAQRKGALFKPNPGQLPVLRSEAQERWVTAGNGGGKTALGAHDAIWVAKGYNPVTKKFNKVPIKVIVVLDAPSKVEDLWIPELKKWFDTSKWTWNKRGKPYISEIVLPNASTINFMFHLQEQMAFEGIEPGHIVLDEPPPRHVYIGLTRGARAKGFRGRVLMIGTPISQAWIRTEIIEPWGRGERPGTECFKFNTEVNKQNLREGYLEEFSAKLSEKERRVRLEGEFYDLSGLALAHLFKRNQHIMQRFDWPENWPCIVAIDPAMSKPTVAMILGVNHDNQLFYIKEMSLKAPAKEFSKELREFYRKFPIVDIVCDSLGSSAVSGGDGTKSFIEVLNENGVRARATTYEDKDDERWMQLIQDVLYIPDPAEGQITIPKLRIFEGNPGITTDIENVQWLKLKNQDMYRNKLDITKKDFLAALKYALAANLTFQKPRAKIHRSSKPLNWRNRMK